LRGPEATAKGAKLPWRWTVSLRVQARDTSLNITVSYDTDDEVEAMLTAQELATRRPELIIEVVRIVGPRR
jgi:hypothetical protein